MIIKYFIANLRRLPLSRTLLGIAGTIVANTLIATVGVGLTHLALYQ
jgi:hypothetical protein